MAPFVYNLLSQSDHELEDDASWALARNLKGNGEAILGCRNAKWPDPP